MALPTGVQRFQKGIDLPLLALPQDHAEQPPDILLGLEVLLAVAPHAGAADDPPVNQ